MGLRAHYSTEAELEIVDISDYLAEHSDSVSDRFQNAVQATEKYLLQNPEIGERFFSDPTLRFRRVLGFKNYVMFYRVSGDELQIIHILHAARELEQILTSTL